MIQFHRIGTLLLHGCDTTAVNKFKTTAQITYLNIAVPTLIHLNWTYGHFDYISFQFIY